MKNLNYHSWILALCVLAFTSCSKENIEEELSADLIAVVTPVNYSPMELEIMDLVNMYRSGKGLSELTILDEISWQAEEHNFHMIAEDEVCHDNFATRYTKLVDVLNAKAVSENVAYGYNSAEAVVQAWMRSKGHRENIEGNLTHFGISVNENSEGKLYFTNIFVNK